MLDVHGERGFAVCCVPWCVYAINAEYALRIGSRLGCFFRGSVCHSGGVPHSSALYFCNSFFGRQPVLRCTRPPPPLPPFKVSVGI